MCTSNWVANLQVDSKDLMWRSQPVFRPNLVVDPRLGGDDDSEEEEDEKNDKKTKPVEKLSDGKQQKAGWDGLVLGRWERGVPESGRILLVQTKNVEVTNFVSILFCIFLVNVSRWPWIQAESDDDKKAEQLRGGRSIFVHTCLMGTGWKNELDIGGFHQKHPRTKYTCICFCICICICIWTCACICKCVCVNVYMCKCVYMYLCI